MRRTLWVNRTWRRFTNDNLSRLDFDRLERRHNVVKGSDASLLLDSCHLSEPWKRLYKRVSKLTKGMHKLEDIWPLNLPVVPPKVSRADFLVNNKFILVRHLL